MRKILFTILSLVTILSLPGCIKYTDITPKGQNLLNRASDLDLLMNINYGQNAFSATRHALLDDDMYLVAVNVPQTIASATVTVNKILLTYDESKDRAALTASDGMYEGMYAIISKNANITLANAETASGDATLLKQLRAESLIIRAWLHYLLVNTYAKAYDPATAATDGGIPYVNDINFSQQNDKKTVKAVYDNIMKDIDAAFALNALPDVPKNAMRVGKAFAYALKAKVLMSTRDYAGALNAANASLAINSTLEDHRPYLSLPRASRTISRVGLTAPDNLFYAFGNSSDPNIFTPTYEILANYYEPGNIIRDSTDTYNFTNGMAYVGLPNIPAWIAINYQGNSAGFTVSDMVMTKAEALIRTGKIQEGMDEINSIRIRRIYPYAAATAATEAAAMAMLQKVSRIEFLFTMRNFINIKRWNREGTYPVVVERTINHVKYTLGQNSPLWIFPFPQSATQFNTTLTQNY
jgi:hypothetical protein